MTYTIEEMTFLCLIQNLNKLHGFPSFTILEKEQSEQAIKLLKEKQILTEENLFTERGLELSSLIHLYENAKKFLKFGENSIFANYKEQEYIMISFIDNKYRIDLVNQNDILVALINKLHHWKEIKDGTYRKRFLFLRKFNEFIEANNELESIVFYKTDIENEEDTKGVFFIDDGYLKLYDATAEEMHMYPRQNVQQGLESIFE